MAFCGHCGAQTEENVKFCPACGKEVNATADNAEADYASPAMDSSNGEVDANDAQANKTMAILAYIFFFVPLLTGAYKNSPFVKYHTNQGTVLFLAALIWGIVYGIVSAILIFIPIIGWLIILVVGLLGFVFLIFAIMGIINAVNGTVKPLPIIGGFTVIK